MMPVNHTAPPDASLAWQYRQWDYAMAEMEERYTRYAGKAPEKSTESETDTTSRNRLKLPSIPTRDIAMDAIGRVLAVGDADEELSVPTPESVDMEAIHTLRESTYVRHCKNRSGELVSEEAYRKGYEARERLREDTLDIAFKLESGGRRAFADPKNPVAFIVCPFTGRFHVLPNVMGRKIFPTVAAAKRARLVAALELLLRTKEHRHDLFLTFTWGPRVVVRKLRKAFQDMGRKISKLNGEPFMRRYGARFIFRAMETGSLTDESGQERRNEVGEILYHPHAHVLMHLDRYLSKKDMADLTRKIGNYWGSWWGIAGAIEKVREVCKYPFKPADLKLLSGPELVALDDALLKLHLVQPMGVLREQIRYRRENCLTVKRERRTVVVNGRKQVQCIPVVVSDWNARKRHRKPDPAVAERSKRREARKLRIAALKAAGGIYEGESYKQADLFKPFPVSDPPEPKETPPKIRPVIRNRVVARLSPAPYFDRVVGPALLVWNFEAAALGELQSLPFVKPALDAVRERVERARAEALRGPGAQVNVHTSPVTVQPRFPQFCHPTAWRPPETPVLAAN